MPRRTWPDPLADRAAPGDPRLPATYPGLPAARIAALAAADLTSLRCLWYGAAPMSAARLEQAIGAIGPVMGQLFGQTEAPMMISTLAPKDHFRSDGTLATERFASAGRPGPLVTVAIMVDQGPLLPPGERGQIVVAAPWSWPAITGTRWPPPRPGGRLASHRRYRLPRRGQLPLHRGPGQGHDHQRRVQRLLRRGRAGLMAHPGLLDCAVVGLPDDKWGEKVTAASSPIPPMMSRRRPPVVRQGASRRRQGPQHVEVSPTPPAPGWARYSRTRSGPGCSARRTAPSRPRRRRRPGPPAAMTMISGLAARKANHPSRRPGDPR